MAEDENKAEDVTDTGEGGESSEESGKKKLAGKKIIIMAVAALVVVGIGGGAGAYFMGAFGGGDEESKKQAEAKTVKPAFFYNLPEMVVNLNSAGGRAEFLKVSIALELAKKNDLVNLKPVEPRIMDVFQVYLRELRRDDFIGSAGLYRLKSELLKRVNIAAYPQKISAVLFKEIIVQ